MDGRPGENIEYDLADTPCQQVYDDEFCFIREDVQAQFPRDPWLADTGAQSYLGCLLRAPNGDLLGHLVVLDDRPLEEGIAEQELFRLISSLMTAEMNARHEEARRLELERQVLEGQRLKSLEVVAGGVAHDFNNLLVGITGNVSLAQAKAPRDSALLHHLDEIDNTARRTTDLAQQMLA